MDIRMPKVNVYWCRDCEKVDIEYEGMIVGNCDKCNGKMEQIGFMEYEEEQEKE
jgi:ribosomal protein L37AE/L43A